MPSFKKTAHIPEPFKDMKSKLSSLSRDILRSPLITKSSKGLIILEEMALYYILAALRTGWDEIDAQVPTVGNTISTEDIMSQFRIAWTRRLQVRAQLQKLADHGFLKAQNEHTWIVARELPTLDQIRAHVKKIKTTMLEYDDVLAIETGLLSHTGPLVYAVLRGRENPLELLFPREDTREFKYSVAHVYSTAPVTQQTKSNLLEAAIAQLLASRAVPHGEDQDKPQEIIRILEVGSGTGSTTASVLKMISEANSRTDDVPPRVEYMVTDISSFFLEKTRLLFAKFGDRSLRMEYKILDIELDPCKQEFDGNYYDIVIAADVIHATMHLDESIKNVRKLLKPGGIFILSEIFVTTGQVELTFGLTDGWWRFADKYRKWSPLVPAKEWENLLLKLGFASTFSIGHDYYCGLVFALADNSSY